MSFLCHFAESFDEKEKERLRTHRYFGVDTSPFSKYILHPFWNWLVQYLPTTLHPNVLTVSGFAAIVVSFLLFLYHDWNLDTHTPERASQGDGIPAYVFMVAALAAFLAHTLDGIDGKQSRRLGLSSPIGEFIDHGADSMVMIMIVSIIQSCVAYNTMGVSHHTTALMYWAVFSNFYIPHYDCYVTGVFFLPWLQDVSMIFYILLLLLCGVNGGRPLCAIGLNPPAVLKLAINLVYIGSAIACLVAGVNIYNCNKTSHDKDKLNPAVSPVVYLLLSLIWAWLESTGRTRIDARLFHLANGLAFSNSTCRLLVCNLCGRPSRCLNPSMLFSLVFVVLAYLEWQNTALLWTVLSLMAGSHLVYFVSAVRTPFTYLRF